MDVSPLKEVVIDKQKLLSKGKRNTMSNFNPTNAFTNSNFTTKGKL